MDSITNKLKNIINIREIYILLTIVLLVLFISISSSLAAFSKTTEKLGIAKVVASDVTQVLSSQEQNYSITDDKHSGTISVRSKSKAVFDITVKTEKSINTKYKMYYQFSDNVRILGVDVGISTQSIDESADIIKPNEEKKVRIVIKNKSDQDANIIVGVQGGYENNEVELYENRTGLEKIPEGWTLSEAILADNTLKTGYEFTEDSDDEGLYKLNENEKISFFKGNVTNNYVEFGTYLNDIENYVYDGDTATTQKVASKGDKILWRVVRINEDGSVKLIAEHNLGTNINFADFTYSSAYSDSTIKPIIDTWYENTFKDGSPELDKLVKQTDYCEQHYTYDGIYDRFGDTLSPTLDCNEGKVNSKAALLTADEAVFAGALIKGTDTIKNIYINNKTYFWTMTTTSDQAYVFSNNSGLWDIKDPSVYNTFGAARPVITIESETLVSADSGHGTKDNPYKIKLTLSETILSSNTPKEGYSFSGNSTDQGLYKLNENEKIKFFKGTVDNNYVSFGTYKDASSGAGVDDPILWRIVRINEDGSVKLLAERNLESNIAFYSELSGYSSWYSSSTIKPIVENWYEKTFTTGAPELDKLVTKTDYCEQNSTDGYDTLIRLSTDPISPIVDCDDGKVNSKVALLTADEAIFAGALVLGTNANTNIYINNNTNFWTMTTNHDQGYVFSNNSGTLSMPHVTDTNGGARPVITLSANAYIKSGAGSSTNPYTLFSK